MRTPRRRLASGIGLAACVLSAFACAAHVRTAQAQVGGHTLLGVGEGDGVSPAVTSPITTQPGGSSLLAVYGGYGSNIAIPTDTRQNAWQPLGEAISYGDYNGNDYSGFSVAAWYTTNARGGGNHSVSVVKRGAPEGEISLSFVEVPNLSVLVDSVANYPALYADTVTSGNVTTTGPATLVAYWWGNGGLREMSAVPRAPFTVIDSFLHLPGNSGVQCAVAVAQVTHAGTYSVTWANNPPQGAILWLMAFQQTGDAVFASSFETPG